MTERDHPEIEELLERTAVRPTGAVDAHGIERRARRRSRVARSAGASLVAAVVVVGGAWILDLQTPGSTEVALDEGRTPASEDEASQDPDSDAESDNNGSGGADPEEDGGGADSDESADEEAGPERPAEPPERWVGAALVGQDDLEVRRHDGEAAETLASLALSSEESSHTLRATDVLLDTATQSVLVGLCCEPTSGQFFSTGLEGAEELDPAGIQGFRADLGGEGSVLARTDTAGIMGVGASSPGGEEILTLPDAGAADVGVDPGPRQRVAALIATDLLLAPLHDSEGGSSVLVVEEDAGGDWQERQFPLDHRACALVFLAEGRVGLLRLDDEHPEDVLDCAGGTLDMLDLGTGEVEAGALEFPEPVRHLSIDDTGHYLIATGTDGSVRWASLDGEGGELADGGFTAADW